MSVKSAGADSRPSRWRAGVGRLVAGTALLTAVALLPWLSGTDPALTVLRARSADADPSPAQLAAVREQLDLDEGPFAHLVQWLGGLPRGDAGTSWVSGEPVLPEVTTAFAVSLTLMLGALVVTIAVAALVCARTLHLGSRRRLRQGRAGTGAAVLAALPKFLLASLLATVCGVWLGWFPSSGWAGPMSMVLPALALGVPSGAVIGGLLDQSLPAAFQEPWARTWHAYGFSPRHIARHALRRTLAGVLPQLLPSVVALVGGAVAVEKIFNIPGLGRLALDAAIAQDLPPLQTATLVLVLLGVVAGLLIQALRRVLLGPALRDGALPALHPCGARGATLHALGRRVLCRRPAHPGRSRPSARPAPGGHGGSAAPAVSRAPAGHGLARPRSAGPAGSRGAAYGGRGLRGHGGRRRPRTADRHGDTGGRGPDRSGVHTALPYSPDC